MTFLLPQTILMTHCFTGLNVILGAKWQIPSDIFSNPLCFRSYTQEMQKQTLKCSTQRGDEASYHSRNQKVTSSLLWAWAEALTPPEGGSSPAAAQLLRESWSAPIPLSLWVRTAVGFRPWRDAEIRVHQPASQLSLNNSPNNQHNILTGDFCSEAGSKSTAVLTCS